MGISQMKYVSVYGNDAKLQQTLSALASFGCFSPEAEDAAIHSAMRYGANQYEPLLLKAKGLLKDMGHSSLAADYIDDSEKYDFYEVDEFLEKFAAELSVRSERKAKLENEVDLYEKTVKLLSRMTDIDVDLSELLQISYMHLRVGRLPKNSYVRLSYYTEKGFNFTNDFNFLVYDFDGEYYWGLYFAPSERKEAIDEIFESLYFERVWIPEFVHGKPEEAINAIKKKEEDLRKELNEKLGPTGIVSEQELKKIQDMTAWLHHMCQLYEMKRYAIDYNSTFYISGFVPKEEYHRFEKIIDDLHDVHINKATKNQQIPVKPPTKLHNNGFVRPFQMFTEMYGLPSTRDIDPTSIVAVIYSLLYGIMFADVGQGLVLFLVSYFIMFKKRGMEIGAVIARCSIFSIFFGFIFGSFFGNEELIGSLLGKMGITAFPLHVMSESGTSLVLVGSIAIGATVVALAILLGVISKFRRGAKGEAITSPNGLCGLIFYLSVLFFLVDMLILNTGISKNPLFIIFLLVLPLIIMYLQEPFAHFINTGKLSFKNASDIFVGGFFEVFVAVLEYMSHTASFLRVGGFVFVHAGMMSVVMTLTEMAGGAAGIIILVIGNIFVIALEGLIVGIQALRLNYYELFSRFYEADGTPFTPLTIKSDTNEL